MTFIPITPFMLPLFYENSFFFQFLSRDMPMHILILTWVENECITSWKIRSYFAQNCSFWSLISKIRVTFIPNTSCFSKTCTFWLLISKMKVTSMRVVCFISSPFALNALFSIPNLWHTYAHSKINRVSKCTH